MNYKRTGAIFFPSKIAFSLPIMTPEIRLHFFSNKKSGENDFEKCSRLPASLGGSSLPFIIFFNQSIVQIEIFHSRFNLFFQNFHSRKSFATAPASYHGLPGFLLFTSRISRSLRKPAKEGGRPLLEWRLEEAGSPLQISRSFFLIFFWKDYLQKYVLGVIWGWKKPFWKNIFIKPVLFKPPTEYSYIINKEKK